MPDRTYARPVKTTSMTISARRELQNRQKLLKQGIVPPSEPEKPKESRRGGLRKIQYTYPPGEAPQVVDPKVSKNKAPPQIPIPVPRLPGQDDLPRSDSPECENLSMYLGKVAPIAQASGSTSSVALDPAGPGPSDNRGRPVSPADTEIEDGEGYSSEADGEGEEDPNRGWGPQGQGDEGGDGDDGDDDDDGDEDKSGGEPREQREPDQVEPEAGPFVNIGDSVTKRGDSASTLSTENRLLISILFIFYPYSHPAHHLPVAASSAQPPPALATVLTYGLPLAAAVSTHSDPSAQLQHPFGPVYEPTEQTFMDIPPEMQDFLLNAAIPEVDNFIPDMDFGGWSEQATIGVPGLAPTGLVNIPDPDPVLTSTWHHVLSGPQLAQPSSQPSLQSGPTPALAPAPAPTPAPTPAPAPAPAPAPTNPFRNDVPNFSPLVRPSPLPTTTSAPAPTSQSSPKPATNVTGPAVAPSGSLRASIPPRITGPNPALRPMPSAPSTPMSRTAHQSRALPTRSVPHAGSPLAAPGSASIASPVTPVRTAISAPPSGTRQAQPASASRSTTPSIGSTPSHLRRPSAAHPHSSPAQRGTVGRAPLGVPRPGPGSSLAPNPRAVSTPERARSASPRPPNTPLAQSMASKPQLRASRSLTPLSRLGSPSPNLSSSGPRTPAEHILPPVTPRGGTLALDNGDRAWTDIPGFSESATDLEEEAWPYQVQPDSANESSHSPQVPRVRTPPPLARAFTSFEFTQSAIDNSNGFILPGPPPDHAFWVDLQPLVTRASPTTAEFAITREREIFLLQQSGRIKSKANPDAGRVKSAKKVGMYGGDPRKLMAIMRAHIQHQFTSVSPWLLSDDTIFKRAKEFAAKHVANLAVDELVDEEFQKSVRISFSQLRGAPLASIKSLVGRTFEIKEGDVGTINWLQDKGRCFYPEYNMANEKFNTKLMIKAVVAVHFRSVRRIAVLTLDDMLEKDNPAAVAELLRMAAVPDDQGVPQAPKIVDRSPPASYGPSIAAIAFAAIHVYHALELLKVPSADSDDEQEQGKKGKGGKKKVEFSESNYSAKWKEYVQDLAKHPKLGVLRTTFMDNL
ncbi:hypothetical protein FRC12_004123, partial [Ceratobasidium sp. 428]